MATLAAGSVIGIGRDDQLPNWYSTIAGLEPLLPAFNDSIFPIDDLSKMVGRTDHERYLAVRDLAYKFVEGNIKGRHHSFAGDNGAQFRILTLTSAEKSIQDMAQQSNNFREGGESFRMIDTPAYFDSMDHIFDRSTVKHLPAKKLEQLFGSIRSACAKNYGCAQRKYIRFLVGKGPDPSRGSQDQEGSPGG